MTEEENKPIPVDGNITPITKRQIHDVRAQEWQKMSINELLDQRSILHSRLIIASQLGNDSLLQQIQVGVSRIDAFIEHKMSNPSEKK